MSYLKSDYESLSESLETSGEILYAIEQVTAEIFGYEPIGAIIENAAYELWEDGGRENEILAALPTENGGSPIEEGKQVFWGIDGAFAEFDGEKWIRRDDD